MHCWKARSVIRRKVRLSRGKVKSPDPAGTGLLALALAIGGALKGAPLRPAEAVHAGVVHLLEDAVDVRLLVPLPVEAAPLAALRPGVAPPLPHAAEAPAEEDVRGTERHPG